MNYGVIVKRELGMKLAQLRLRQRRRLFEVKNDTGIALDILDAMEIGQSVGWRNYTRLMDYYGCKITLTARDDA